MAPGGGGGSIFEPSVAAGSGGGGSRGWLWAALGALVIAAGVGGFLILSDDDSGDDTASGADATDEATDEQTDDPETTTTEAPEETTTQPSDETTTTAGEADPCAAIRELERWACITDIRLEDGDVIVADYEFQLADADVFSVDAPAGVHMHFYGSRFNFSEVGGDSPEPGLWQVWDVPNQFGLDLGGNEDNSAQIALDVAGGSDALCVVVTLPPSGHNVHQDSDTGNCVPFPEDVLEAISAAGG